MKKITNNKVYLFFIILWGILILVIQPIVNFPLNDDWSYAFAVQSLVENKDLEYRGWMSMTLFAQVLWGSLFVKMFGFSFTILHISTVILGYLGSVFTYLLAKKLRLNQFIALLIAIVLTLNPIYLNLSFTFMTDIPFYTFSIISIYSFVCYLSDKKNIFLIIGILFCIFSILTRQLGLAIPLALLFIGILKKEWKLSIPFFISASTYLIYQYTIPFFITDLGRSNEHNLILIDKIIHHPFSLSIEIIKRGTIFFIYFGLLFAPILVFLRLPKGKFVDWILFGFSLISVYILYQNNFLMPLGKNVLVDFGIGPHTLYDAWVSQETNLKSMPLFSKVQLTFIGIMYGYKLIEALLLKTIRLKYYAVNLPYETGFLLLIAICYLIPSLAIDNFDRYYLLVFPIVLISIATFFNFQKTFFEKFQWIFMMCILFLFSTLGNKDYFEWQKARWKGISYLQKDLNIPNNKIDGGFEYNGWHNYNPNNFNDNVKNLWVPDDTYKICFEKINNYSVIKEIKYTEWLKFGKTKTIKVLQKDE